MFINNPEFKKNLKLEFSWVKLLVPVFMLAITAWLGWSNTDSDSWRRLPDIYKNSESLTFWMFGFGFIFSIVWGSYLASNSFFGEVRQKTWDFVRMSPLTPDKILVGKLFGATSSVWMITLIGIIPIILFASSGLFLNDGYHRPAYETLISLTSALIFWMILSYSFVLLNGLYTSSKDSRHNTISVVLLALVGGLFIGGFISASYQMEYRLNAYCNYHVKSLNSTPCNDTIDLTYNGINYTKSNIRTVNWYDTKLFPLDSIAYILGFFALWSVVGTYRNLQKSLQYKISPIIWPVFIISTVIFLYGFYWDNRELGQIFFLGALLTALLTIPVSIKESRNTIQYRQWFENLKVKNYKESFRNTPLWVLSLLFFLIASPVIFLMEKNYS
jgi:hypothetical protein